MFKLFPAYSSSLKSRITLLTLAITLFVFLSLMLFAGQALRPRLKELLATQQLASVSLVAGEINEALVFRLKSLDKLAKRLTPATLTSGKAAQALLDESFNDADLFNSGLIVIDAQGDILAETPLLAHRIGVNVKDRDYFKAVMAQGKSAISPPLTDKKSLRPTVVMSVPVRDAQGRVVGALAGLIDLSLPNFIDRITKIRYGRTGETFLVTPQTRMIVSTSDKKRIMEVLPAPGVSAWIDRFMEGYEGSVVTENPHGLEVLVSVKHLPVSGWYASVILSTEELFAPLNEVRRTISLSLPHWLAC